MDIDRLRMISVVNLKNICRRHMRMTYLDSQSRTSLYSAISSQNTTVQELINADANRAIENGLVKYGREVREGKGGQGPSKRRKVNEDSGMTGIDEGNVCNDTAGSSQNKYIANSNAPSEDRTAPREYIFCQAAPNDITEQPVAEQPAALPNTTPDEDDLVERLLVSEFMKTPSQEVLNSLVSDFVDATSNNALKTVACGSCARETNINECDEVLLKDIPNRHQLVPHTPHPAHELFHGLLIYAPAISVSKSTVTLCDECQNQLKKNQRPRLSLSNDMWIGDIPRELQGLTLPERVLLGKYFPTAYIIKLFPKQKNAHTWDHSQMHSALKGNVSTYRLDPRQVAGLMDGRMFPPPAKILAATIGITFVGPKGVREPTMPAMFRVRRWRVREALVWLKANNTLYTDIEILEERLTELPEDGVPNELTMTAKYSTDTRAVEREHEGYVPTDAGDDNEDVHQALLRETGLIEDDASEESEETEPEIIAIQSMGVVDVDGCDITSTEIMAHALANSTIENQSGDYTIRRGSAFVNEYARTDSATGLRNDGGPSNPNHLLGSFPTLFPYGKGGFETSRPINVPYETHAKWTMQYADKRFRKDIQFPFQIFGICQKRDVCRSSVLQMKRQAFTRHINLISTLKPQDLVRASQEETRKVRFSNPAVQALRDQLGAVRTRVKGTDESRQHVRSKIWGTNLIFNPPTIWITINPADTQDPIAQVFAGEEIDLDSFCNTAGPTNNQRASNVAGDPYSSAKYFHFIVKCVLEILFGISKRKSGRIDRKEGIFGKIQSYIGTVEAQGRGTLHLHMLLWLKDAPRASEMKTALKSKKFREKLVAFIKSSIRASIGDMTHAQVAAMPKTAGVSYSRPVDPRLATIHECEDSEKKLVRALQYHQCSVAACLQVVKGQLICKRRAPFKTASLDWADEDGRWGPKRLCSYLNSWNPTIMRTIRANHDVKLIIGGDGQTATLTYYITNYATKKQQRSSNASALLARRLAFIQKEDHRQTDLNKINKKLIQSCANCLTRDCEFSAPEIISYIMGWLDVYLSHYYVTIYWSAAVFALTKAYPNIITQRYRTDNTEDNTQQEEMGTVTAVDGIIELKDQLRDYKFRGEELTSMSFLEFMLETYEDSKKNKEDETGMAGPVNVGNIPIPRRPGRPCSTRIPYQEEARKGNRCRIKRLQGHETLPRFVGKWFCRSDNEHERDLFRASMLMLLKPWRDLRDLKGDTETFEEVFDGFMSQADDKATRVVANVKYYFECSDAAKADRKKNQEEGERPTANNDEGGIDMDIGIGDDVEGIHTASGEFEEITEADIERARMMRTNARERLYGESAVVLGYDIGFFEEAENEENTNDITSARKMVPEEGEKIRTWKALLKSTTREQMNRTGTTDMTEELNDAELFNPVIGPMAMTSPDIQLQGEQMSNAGHVTSIPTQRSELARLNENQRRAHDIIEERLKEHITNGQANQLRMLILGEGGVGKTTLISAVTETFRHYDKLEILAKCATTGVAAVGIGACTLHSWAALPNNMPKDDDWLDRSTKASKDKRRANIRGKEFLIIDEVSMEDKDTAYRLSEIVGKSRAEEDKGTPQEPYGSMHIIKTGDFHQFPPVGNPTGALYVDRPDKDKKQALLGREIFLQFDTVVILDEQNRINDRTWNNILSRARVGECNANDLHEIEKLVLTNPECNIPDFSKAPWDQAILVTPRHTVRNSWNDHALAKHCMKTRNQCYIVPAKDTLRGTSEELSMEAKLAIASVDDAKTGKLPASVRMAIGMKAMVLLNIATEADVANGTRGGIQDIILDEREDPLTTDDEGTITLKYPPAMLLFRPDKKSRLKFTGLPPGIIPLTPSIAPFAVVGRSGKKFKISRSQYAMTAGYAFTDYKSQGQTIEYVIIDIGKPPTGCLSPFSVYVALSRSRGRDTIRLLRDFDPKLFQRHPSEALRSDMRRLEELNESTKREWLARRKKSTA